MLGLIPQCQRRIDKGDKLPYDTKRFESMKESHP